MNAMTFREAYNSNKFRGTNIDLEMYGLLLSHKAGENMFDFDGWSIATDSCTPDLTVYFKGDTLVRFFVADGLIGIGKKVETIMPDTIEQFIVLYRLAQRGDESLPDLEWDSTVMRLFQLFEKAA
jgi:hypothetical protein